VTTTIPIDKEALRTKYLAERGKRLRPDGNDQYLRLAGTSLAHYLDDPLCVLINHPAERALSRGIYRSDDLTTVNDREGLRSCETTAT